MGNSSCYHSNALKRHLLCFIFQMSTLTWGVAQLVVAWLILHCKDSKGLGSNPVTSSNYIFCTNVSFIINYHSCFQATVTWCSPSSSTPSWRTTLRTRPPLITPETTLAVPPSKRKWHLIRIILDQFDINVCYKTVHIVTMHFRVCE